MPRKAGLGKRKAQGKSNRTGVGESAPATGAQGHTDRAEHGQACSAPQSELFLEKARIELAQYCATNRDTLALLRRTSGEDLYDHFLFRLLAEFKEHLPIAWSFFAIGTKRPPRKSTARAERYRSSVLTEENVRELPVLAAMATWIKSHNQQMSGMAAYRQMLLACESATRMVSARALISCHSLCLS